VEILSGFGHFDGYRFLLAVFYYYLKINLLNSTALCSKTYLKITQNVKNTKKHYLNKKIKLNTSNKIELLFLF